MRKVWFSSLNSKTVKSIKHCHLGGKNFSGNLPRGETLDYVFLMEENRIFIERIDIKRRNDEKFYVEEKRFA